MSPFNWSRFGMIVLVYSIGFASGAFVVFRPAPPEATSIASPPGGGEILLRKGETPESFCYIVGQIVTSGPSPDAQGRGRMFFARTCDDELSPARIGGAAP